MHKELIRKIIFLPIRMNYGYPDVVLFEAKTISHSGGD